MKIPVQCLIVLICVPLVALADAYKCKQPNGSMSFQDTPCAKDAVGSTVALPKIETVDQSAKTAEGNPKKQKSYGLGGTPQSGESDYQKERAAKAAKEQKEEVDAKNKMAKCQRARQQLDVLNVARPVYKVDSNGNRNYVSDDNRAAEIAAEQQKAAEACN
jgi:hypothetical protein